MLTKPRVGHPRGAPVDGPNVVSLEHAYDDPTPAPHLARSGHPNAGMLRWKRAGDSGSASARNGHAAVVLDGW